MRLRPHLRLISACALLAGAFLPSTESFASITPLAFANDGTDLLSPAILPPYVFTVNNMPSNPSEATVAGWAGVPSLTELYKKGNDGSEDKVFKDSYSLTYAPPLSSGDGLSAGVLEYDGAPDPIMAAVQLFLMVKDGNQSPSNYLYDISNWDRMSDINLSGYWANANGGISHVSIYGINDTSEDVVVEGTPEAASLLIWCGLAGAFGYGARRRLRTA